MERPARMSLCRLAKIKTNCCTRIAIAFNDDGMAEPSFLNAQAKPARSGKKFN